MIKDFSKTKTYKEIVSKRIPCYFISPHFDDVVLSAGCLMADLAKKTKVNVINVFTSGGSANTLSAKKALQNSGYKSSNKYYEAREIEDRISLNIIKIKPKNLGLSEALWREKSPNLLKDVLQKYIPEIGMVYPTYKFHVSKGKISRHDKNMIDEIVKTLQKSKVEKDAYIFAPYGIGKHVDHIVVKKAVEKFNNVIFWADFPYWYRENYTVNKIAKTVYKFSKNTKTKEEMIAKYKTQVGGLFNNSNIVLEPDIFILNK